ncbi:MAG: hypothetical protein ACRDBL_09115 [Rhabdaerophilum sp.]
MPENAIQWISAVNGLITIGTLVFVWLTRSGKEANEKVAALDVRLTAAIKDRDAKIDLVEDRISRVEGELKGVPDRDSVHKMQIEMVAMRGSIDVLAERLKPVLAITNRMQEAMIEERK